MASIQSGDVESLREAIVDPLVSMMSRLSGEMQKNLSEEVSSIRVKIEEVSHKVDYLISKVEGNNSKGEQRSIPDSHLFSQPFKHTLLQQSEGGSFEDTEARCVERTAEHSAGFQQHDQESKSIFLQKCGIAELRDKRFDPHKESKTYFILENIHNQAETSEPSSSLHEITEEEDENRRQVKLLGQEGENEDESNSETEQDENIELESRQKKNLEHELENEKRERKTLPLPSKDVSNEDSDLYGHNESNGLEDHGPVDDSPIKPFATALSAEEPNTGRQKRFNFGNAEINRRPQSPIPSSTMTENVSYTRFKKIKTEITEDNRKTYLENVITIQHSDEGKKGEDQISGGDNQVNEGENQVNKGENQINKDENLQSKIANQNQENDRTPKTAAEKDQDKDLGQGQRSYKMSNNQQLALSGFRNEHGEDDNRFQAAAHDELTFAPLAHRSLRLSNLHLVKNGPRRHLLKDEEVASNQDDEFTAQDEGKATGRADLPIKSPNKEDNGQLVSDDVLYSIIEQERISASSCSDVKSEGIDTVICLDTSSSMAGQPIKIALKAVNQLINGFENNAIYNDLEENVAITTFGKENKILCHLTNDYGLLRDSIATVTTGGPSPLWLGLALSLAEIKERGGACAMNPMTVRPRIILISDGFASRKNLLEGDDNNEVDAQVIREILSLLNTCRSFTSYMECITPGPFHENILTTLADDRIFTVNDVDHMTQFFRVQENANDIVKKVISGELNRDNIDEIVQTSHLGKNAKKELKNVVKQALMSFPEESEDEESKGATKENVRKTASENQDTENILSTASEEDKPEHGSPQRNKGDKAEEQSTTEEKVGESSVHSDSQVSLHSVDVIDSENLPVFGMAVIRNTGFEDSSPRQTFTGTVIGARKKGLVKVLWSDGTMENCKYGIRGQYDVKVLDDQSIDSREIRVGSIVTRGKDWRWKDQDGGEGNTGVVLKIDGPVVHVFWSHGGQGNYRYGYKEKYDLKLSKIRFTEAGGTNCVWFIQDENEHWRPFPNDVSQSIEQMYKANCTTTFLVKTGENSLRISIPKLQARDTNTNSVYSIERRELSRKELLAVTAEQ